MLTTITATEKQCTTRLLGQVKKIAMTYPPIMRLYCLTHALSHTSTNPSFSLTLPQIFHFYRDRHECHGTGNANRTRYPQPTHPIILPTARPPILFIRLTLPFFFFCSSCRYDGYGGTLRPQQPHARDAFAGTEHSHSSIHACYESTTSTHDISPSN